jgi:ProP effector
MRGKLCELFPACFRGIKQPKLPLKVGIHVDILARVPDIDGRVLSNALNDYVSGATYADAMVIGAKRVDLDGNPAGEIGRAEAFAYRRIAAMIRQSRKAWHVRQEADKRLETATALLRAASEHLKSFDLTCDHDVGCCNCDIRITLEKISTFLGNPPAKWEPVERMQRAA